MSERRPSRHGPGGSRRPGPRAGARSRPTAPPAAAPGGTGSGRSGAAVGTARPAETGSRFTGRAAILILVVVVLAISYASSMRAYLQQRAHIAEVKEQIDSSEATIEELRREKRRWDDDAFVQAQARERFGYVLPGETLYQVIDEDGRPLDRVDTLSDPDALPTAPTPWWETAWDSVETAGDPPEIEEHSEPADRIRVPPESRP